MLHWICNLSALCYIGISSPHFVMSFDFLQESLFVYMCSSELVYKLGSAALDCKILY